MYLKEGNEETLCHPQGVRGVAVVPRVALLLLWLVRIDGLAAKLQRFTKLKVNIKG